MKRIIVLGAALILILLSFFVTSCKKDKSDISTPIAPSEESFVLNFSDFSNGKSSKTFVNKANAVIYVGVWNTLLAVNLATPIAAFKGTIKETVKLVEPNHWMWEYQTSLFGITFNSQLHAYYSDGKINWEMHISQDGAYQDFVWFTGTSNVEQTNGSWTIYKSPADSQAYMTINWEKNSDNTVAFIKYENVLVNDANNGAYIEYGVNTNTDFNRYYNIVGTEASNYANIEWNSTSKNGRIKAPNSFRDDVWHYWDANGADATGK
jgi:hypothetical protein